VITDFAREVSMAAKYTVDQVADALIHLSRERGYQITNLKLQKLLYYAQAWSLVINGKPLFDDDFEAWVHGPVVPQVFRRFKEYRWNDITEAVHPPSDKLLFDYLSLILDKYGKLSPRQLEHLTHAEDPWKLARKGYAPDESSSETISKDSIKSYYWTRIESTR
jgi:uncharacterized phage-associated protein